MTTSPSELDEHLALVPDAPPPESAGPGSTELALEDACTLLGEGDPGPTPFLVADFLVLGAIAALVGAYKVGKTWVVLELAIAIAAGERFLGRYSAERGPVMLILEESGRRALHRRLALMVRGRDVERSRLSQLHFAANRGVNLSDPEWRRQILEEADRLSPLLVVFDPLARVKGAGVDESSQLEIGPVLSFMRELREVSGAAVLFVHHTGHEARERMRGSSDLEAYWESKISIRGGEEGYEIRADHREAESTPPVGYRLDFADEAMRFELDQADDELAELILGHLAEHPGATNAELRKAVPRRAVDTTSRLLDLEKAGTVCRRPSQRTDRAGRAKHVDAFFVSGDAPSPAVPVAGQAGTGSEDGAYGVPLSAPLRADTGQGTGSEGGEGAST